MKRLTLILSMVLLCVTAGAQVPFAAGEKLRMGMYFKWGAVNTEVASGELSLQETSLNGEQVFKSVLVADSAPFFSVFYDMHEHFETWFPQDTVRPLKYIRNTKQGDYRAFNHYIYDWDEKLIHADINFEGRGQQILDIPVHDSVCDITSILYQVRAMDFDAFEPGQKTPMSFAIDDTVFDILLTYWGKERIKVKRVGWVNATRFSCSVVSGALFDGKTEMSLWFSADSNKVPVGFVAPLKIGSVQGWMKSVSGLKYPFEAKVR